MNQMMKIGQWAVVSLMVGLAGAQAEVRVAEVFSDHMVLPRDRPLAIWGQAAAGEGVQVKLGSASGETKADGAGKWKVELPAQAAASGLELQVNGTVFKNVAVGEVWICAGQSNMGWPLAQSRQIQDQEMLNIAVPSLRLNEPGKGWREAAGKTVGSFSAVGYFFGRELQEKLKVPVGVISLTQAGSLLADWRSGQAGNAFDRLVRPWAAFGVNGVLWYHGESEVSEAAAYRKRFPEMILDWRKQFNQPKLPFYFVRLADYGLPQNEPVQEDGGWPLMRESQAAALALPDTFMTGAPIVQVGVEPLGMDVHSIERKSLGVNLANQVLKRYTPPPATPAPPLPPLVYERMEVVGQKLRLIFPAGTVEFKPEASPKGFAIRAKDGEWKWAEVAMVKDPADGGRAIIELTHPEVATPTAARYKWAGFPVGNMTDAAGRTLQPFRTDL